MTQQEIIEANKLIAEFMGIKVIPVEQLSEDERAHYPDGRVTMRIRAFEGNGIAVNKEGKRVKVVATHAELTNASRLYFDCVWDWLMPVVEKIEQVSIKGFERFYNHEGYDGEGYFNLVRDRHSARICAGLFFFQKDRPVDGLKEHDGSGMEPIYAAVLEFIRWYNENKA